MAPDLTVPFAPRNMMVTSPYIIGMTDIRWDNPRLIPQNNGLQITGVNVYRAIENPYGPYELITDSPVGVLFYRDQTQEELVTEDVTATLKYSIEPDGYWRVYAQHKPIVTLGSNGKMSDRVEDVKVEIDNGDGIFIEVPAFTLNGKTGEVVLISKPTFNYAVEQVIPPRLPWPPNGKVKITYRYLKHSVLSVLGQRIFYKATTVAVDPKDNSKRIETPLDEVEFRSTIDIEEIDWIWREAMKRNGYILEQAGERVKVFVRKSLGEKCPHYQYGYGQSFNDCVQCYGTNILGGYFGPIDIIIAPPEAEKAIELLDMGLHIRYDYETWSGAFPTLKERDVIVRQSNERFTIGPVNYQGARGAVYQQHFTIAYIDEGDIRYRIPITGGEASVPPSTDLYREKRKSDASPVINDKPEIPKDRIIRGKTVTFENITF
jgi:hypothetical protein